MLRVPPAPAPAVERLVHGSNHGRVLAHAEIVVGAPHRDFAGRAVRMADGAWEIASFAFHVGEDAIAPFLLEVVQPACEKRFEIHANTP
jgi:hypothetical protein